MKICIAGSYHPYGEGCKYGAERLQKYIADQLVKLGHEVTIIAVKGTNVPGCKIINVPKPYDNDVDIYYDIIKDLDVDFVSSFVASGKIDERLRAKNYCVSPYFSFTEFRENLIVSSAKHNSVMNNIGTVINYGIPDMEPCYEPEDFLVFLGRIDSGKNPLDAIKVAKRAGKRLVIIGPSYDYSYFKDNIWEHVDNDKIIFFDAATDQVKHRVLRKSLAFLSTNWNHYHEYFGLVNIESLRSGTPVIAWGERDCPSAVNFGGTGEIIISGKHGFINEYVGYSDEERERAIDRAVEYVKRIGEINRRDCRKQYEKKFTSEIMTKKYLKYYNIVRERQKVFNITEEINRED